MVCFDCEELLLRDGGIPLLLGARGCGSEGALRRFIPDAQSQHVLLLEAARQCQDSGFQDKVSAMYFMFVDVFPGFQSPMSPKMWFYTMFTLCIGNYRL